MREYGQIQSAFWTHPDIQPLPIEVKVIGAYLLTCQHTSGIGCFRMPVGYISIDLGIPIETVSKGFDQLYRKGFLEYDKPSEYILIPEFLRWNPISNPNSAKARAKEFDAIPSSISIYPNLIKALQKNGRYWSDDFLNRIETLSKGFRNGIERVPADVPDNRPYQTLPDPNQTRPEQHSTAGESTQPEEKPEPRRQLIATLAALGFRQEQVHTPKVIGLVANWEQAELKPEELTNLVESLRQRDKNKTFGPAYLELPVKSYLETRNGKGNSHSNQGNGSGKNKHQVARALIQADIERCFGPGAIIGGIHGQDETDIPGEVDSKTIEH